MGAFGLITVGAWGFGIVLGWAMAFVGPSRAGLGFRLLVAIAAIASLSGFGAVAIGAGCAGLALGVIAHEALILALRRRIA